MREDKKQDLSIFQQLTDVGFQPEQVEIPGNYGKFKSGILMHIVQSQKRITQCGGTPESGQ
jgi:hypothetical protein